MAPFLEEASAKVIVLAIYIISCMLWYRLFKEIVSTMAANRDPYSQRHVQADITRDTGSEWVWRKVFEDIPSTLA